MSYSRWTHRFELKPGSWVFVPDEEARKFGKYLKEKLQASWRIPRYYAHLRQGGHVAALKRHIGDTHFMSVDIQNFFGSIGITRVTRMLKTFMRYADAREAAQRSVVIDPSNDDRRILPFGFVQSPIIASICLRQSALGRYVEEVSKASSVTASVYMDDIIVSTRGTPNEAKAIFDTLCDKATRSSFTLAPEKLNPPSDRLVSFNIELNSERLVIVDPRLDRLTALCLAGNHNTRAGVLGYVAQVSDEQAAQLESSIAGALPRAI